MSDYILKRGEIYYYRRRIPQYVQPYETRSFIKISLGTRDKKEALRKAAIYNDYIEDYWRNLIKAGGKGDAKAEYRATVKLAKAHGFAYKNMAEIVKSPLEDIVERVGAASKAIESPEIVSSILGGTEVPKVLLSECIEQFWPLSADRLANKSENQIRKWKNPRIASMNTFIEVIGDKPLSEVTRRDVLQYRQWWMDRVNNGDVVASTVNKNIMYTRDIMQIVGMHHEIDTDFELLFAKIRLKETEQSRPPFEARAFAQRCPDCRACRPALNQCAADRRSVQCTCIIHL